MPIVRHGGYYFLGKQFHSTTEQSGMGDPADEFADDLPEAGYGETIRAFVKIVPQSGRSVEK